MEVTLDEVSSVPVKPVTARPRFRLTSSNSSQKERVSCVFDGSLPWSEYDEKAAKTAVTEVCNGNCRTICMLSCI